MENTNGISPFTEIDADRRITEICDTLSIGASIENILLKAEELGLGTLWIANTCFAYPELVTYLNMKGQLIGTIAVGYPDEKTFFQWFAERISIFSCMVRKLVAFPTIP